MKKFLLLTAIAVAFTVSGNAAKRRVGFFGPFVTNVDYSTFAAAYTAATAGDTILVFPGVTNISQTISKKIIVIGPGDWLDPTSTPKGNANLQAYAGVATVSSFTFAAGSSGTVIAGLEGGSYYVEDNNITIMRNRGILIYLAITTLSYSNLQILENYMVNISDGGATSSNVTNMNISNNLMYSFSTSPGNTYSGNISNNVWVYDATLTAALDGGSSTMSYTGGIELGGGAYLLQNNIFESYTNSSAASNYNYFIFSNGGNSVFNYNLALQSATPINWGVGTGNVITPIANASSIFAAFPAIGTTSADARYKLGASSPAATVGSGSKPIGMFAGTNTYKLGLIPSIPTIYQLSSPQGNNPTGSTITIDVSTRGNN